MTLPRRRSAPAILAAARQRFGTDGYERTTLRAIAGDVGIDAAMVNRHFGTKEALFAEAAGVDLHLPDLTGIGADDLTEELLPHFFVVSEDNTTFLACSGPA